MARALECPTCATRHSLEAVEAGSTFGCTGCGRTLRAPMEPVGASPASEPAPPTVAVAGSRAGRRRAAGESREAPAVAPAPPGFPVGVRIVAWVIALVVGAFVSLWLARVVGLLTADNLVDVITGSGGGRYVRLGVFVILWALVATALVTLLIDGGWRLLRRGVGATTPAPASAAADPSTVARPQPSVPSTPMPARGTDQRPRRIPPRDTGA